MREKHFYMLPLLFAYLMQLPKGSPVGIGRKTETDTTAVAVAQTVLPAKRKLI